MNRKMKIEVDGRIVGTALLPTITFRSQLNHDNAAWCVLDKEDRERLGIHRNDRVILRECEE